MGYFEDSINKRFAALEARLSKLENPPPCTYEIRGRHTQPRYSRSYDYTEDAAWCTRHGWDCPNAQGKRE
jgi:hypothetical protein